MVEVPLPPGIERRCIGPGRGPVSALHARPERAAGRTSVMVCGFMATTEDFRQILPLLARAGHDAWAYDHVGQHGGEPAVGRDDGPERYTIASMAQEGREVIDAVGAGGPVHVVLGIADDEAIRLGRLTRQVSGAFDQFATARQHARTAAAGAELVDRLTAIISGQRGASDLLAGLAGSGSAADEQELIGSAVMLFAAGVDSPASMVGLGTQLLLRHPDQAGRLRRQPELAARAVAEILRYEPPVQLVARAAVTPVELEGRPVPAGSMVFGLVAAGNRDPPQFKAPETFDLTREQVPSLSFGAGPHYCLGAYLTGMQGEILFPRLLDRFPRLRPAGDPAYRTPGSTLRGLDRLPLRLD